MTSEAALSKYPQWTFCLPLTLRCWTACGFMLQVSSLYTDTLGPFYIQIYVSNPYVSKVQTHISLPSQFFYFDVYSVSTEPLHCPFACDSPLHPPHYNTLDQNPWGHPWCLYFYDTLQSNPSKHLLLKPSKYTPYHFSSSLPATGIQATIIF